MAALFVFPARLPGVLQLSRQPSSPAAVEGFYTSKLASEPHCIKKASLVPCRAAPSSPVLWAWPLCWTPTSASPCRPRSRRPSRGPQQLRPSRGPQLLGTRPQRHRPPPLPVPPRPQSLAPGQQIRSKPRAPAKSKASSSSHYLSQGENFQLFIGFLIWPLRIFVYSLVVGELRSAQQIVEPSGLPSSGYSGSGSSHADRPKAVPLAKRSAQLPDGVVPKGAAPSDAKPQHSQGEASSKPTAGYPSRGAMDAGATSAALPTGEVGISRPLAPDALATPSAHCTISEGGGSEIRTKVFRIGAPLLRSTIPVSIGGRRESKTAKTAPQVNSGDGSDVETILSLSEEECAEEGQLSVTLDFPC